MRSRISLKTCVERNGRLTVQLQLVVQKGRLKIFKFKSLFKT